MILKTWSYLVCALTVSAASADATYTKKDTWEATMHASRAAMPNQASSTAVRLGKWHLSGPYKGSDLKKRFLPEQGVTLDATGPDGRPLWVARPDYVDNGINRLPKGQRVFYVYRRIESDGAHTLTVGIGADDGCGVWLNGKKVLWSPGPRGITPNEDIVELDLQAGTNHLLMKVYDRGGAYAFWFARLDDPAFGVWERTKKDFPSECDAMEHDLRDGHLGWFRQRGSATLEQEMIKRALGESRPYDKHLTATFFLTFSGMRWFPLLLRW